MKIENVVYRGRQYDSVKELSNEMQVNYRKLLSLIHSGLTSEEAVDTIRKKKYELNGKYYKNLNEIAKDMGISRRVLEQSSVHKELRQTIKPVTKPFEFQGIYYPSREAFYEHIGLSPSGVRKYAVRNNLTTQEALVELVNVKERKAEKRNNRRKIKK